MKIHQSLRSIGASFMLLILWQGIATATTTFRTPPGLQFSIAVPETVKPAIVRQDFENQSIFTFQNGKSKPAFLFSITKVTTEQWLQIKANVKNYTILGNKDGYITFLERTGEASIKGSANGEYQKVLLQLNTIIASIQLD